MSRNAELSRLKAEIVKGEGFGGPSEAPKKFLGLRFLRHFVTCLKHLLKRQIKVLVYAPHGTCLGVECCSFI